MGGTGLYRRPVDVVTGISSWTAHTKRGTPSTEPGTDWYCPRGTPVHAASGGVVVDVGDSIQPATGRFVTIDLDDGRRVRYLHLERRHVKVGDRVVWGQHIADSGATGYGEADWSWNVAETGGAHVHETIFPSHRYVFGRYATLDPQPLTEASDAAASTSEPKEWDEMASKEDIAKVVRENMNAAYRRIRITVPGVEGEHWHIVSNVTGIAIHIFDQSDNIRFDRLEDPNPDVLLIPSDLAQLKARYFDKINPPPAPVDVSEVEIAAQVIAGLSPEAIAAKIVEYGVGPSVADFLAERLKG